ncbi:MAG: hypothetical protein JSU90_01105 [Nitrospiraceae bacterium]|nr:MAG: hypothetical protein JSU90_01105 [Nitrospiraceae bacterium]
MKKTKLIIFLLSVIAGFALVAVLTGGGTGSKNGALASDTGDFETKFTGSMENGDALVGLTPVIDRQKLVVKFSINTHSVGLNEHDLTESTVLEYGGKIVKPLKASRIGGHHSSGKIVFDFDGRDKIFGFTIKIKGIPSIPERIYEWSMS